MIAAAVAAVDEDVFEDVDGVLTRPRNRLESWISEHDFKEDNASLFSLDV